MKILFLHGWSSVPGGIKPTYLADRGHQVLNPQLPDDDFRVAVRIAQSEFDTQHPDVIVGSSRGGAVAMNIDAGETPLVLLCPAWKKWGTVNSVKKNTTILHSRDDDVVPFADSEALVNNSGLPPESLIEVGNDHQLAEPEPLAEMLAACERAGEDLPQFIYGTAWKEAGTRRLTELALQQGFRGIDTANQRRHYHEAAVGDAIASSIGSGLVRRKDLFLQTKFTFRRGQDHRLPYDPKATIAEQVEQSFARSLEHLRTDVVDSYLLHGPSQGVGLAAADWEAWRAMEAICDGGRTRMIGISNVTRQQLEILCQDVRIPPRMVQNRCYAITGWDRAVREFCRAGGIIYQGFSLLTANRQVLSHQQLADIAAKYGRSTIQIVFRFALDVGMVPLTGTSNPNHMRTDLDVLDFQLDPVDVQQIETLE